MSKIPKGITFALTTALISGVSVFINGFAAKTFTDPFIFTTLKNLIVALFLSSALLGLISINQLKKLRFKDWLILIIIGLVGGSIPFLLFFKGLSLSSSSVAAFLHKTLFIWAAIGAFFWLKEKISWHHLLGFLALTLGLILLSPWQKIGFGWAEILVLIATLLWSIESVLVRKISHNSSYFLISNFYFLPWGRMFFGAVFMLIYLGLVGKVGGVKELTATNWWWLILTSVFLLGYVTSWYAALKHAPVLIAASILAFGFPITVLLQIIFVSHQLPTEFIFGFIFLLLAALVFKKALIPETKIKIS